MISRRIIRVKVMQTLYSLETQDTINSAGDAINGIAVRQLQRHFDQSRQLLVYLTWFLTEVARYAETDSRNRASKHLPSKNDLEVNTKICGNDLLWKIIEHPSFQKAMQEDKPELNRNPELIKKIYQDLAATDKYHDYINKQSRDKKEEKDILEFILTDLMLPNDTFTSFLEEKFPNWDDDGEVSNALLMSFLSKPNNFNFQDLIGDDKWTFGKGLLQTAIEKKELTLDYIKPKLKNWDPDRIAILDMLMMRLGVCEFLFFETIPPKVTINEYIDLAKEYSTAQSGQFINGILDNIHKDLVRDDKMHKVSFKSS
ncbi:MAG: transcription antitermination factor NusB [Flavitalea sp.]